MIQLPMQSGSCKAMHAGYIRDHLCACLVKGPPVSAQVIQGFPPTVTQHASIAHITLAHKACLGCQLGYMVSALGELLAACPAGMMLA